MSVLTDRFSSDDREVWGAISEVSYALALLDLADLTLYAANHAALAMFDLAPTRLSGMAVYELLDPIDRDEVMIPLRALAQGTIDFYAGHRTFVGEGAKKTIVYVYVRAIALAERRIAIVAMTPEDSAHANPLASQMTSTPISLALGLTDANWIVTTVSCDFEAVVGIDSAVLLEKPLIGAIEQQGLVDLLHENGNIGDSYAVSLHLATASDVSPLAVRCLLTPLAGTSSWCFILFPDAEAARGGGRPQGLPEAGPHPSGGHEA